MSHDNGRHQVYRYTMLSKNVLVGDESELYELATMAGVVIDPNVFKIIVDLLRMNVAPSAIERMLKSMLSSAPKSKAQSTGDAHPPTHSGREMPNPPNAPASSKRRFPPSGKSHDRRTQEKPKS